MSKLIAFCGVKGSGKTTAFNAVNNNFENVHELTLAGPLKDFCSEVFNVPRNHFDDQNLKEVEFDVPVYLESEDLIKMIDKYGLEYDFDTHVRPLVGTILHTPRRIAQCMGTNLLNNIDKFVHCKYVSKNIPEDKLCVLTDMRFPQEHEFFSKLGFEFYPLYISNATAEAKALKDPHPSEQMVMVTAKKCRTLDNNKNLSEFETLVIKTARGILEGID